VAKCTPVSILGTKKTFCRITSGFQFSLGISKNGETWSWGLNDYGQLGDSNTTNVLTPISVWGNKKTFCQITTGHYTSIGIDKNGQVWSWGSNVYGEIGDNTTTSKCTPVSILGNKKTFCQITGAYNHTLGIDKNGQIWSWGRNDYGQLGDNTKISKCTPVSILGNKKTFCQIDTGGQNTVNFGKHSSGIDKNGQIWTWGINPYGGLGDNSTTSRLTPVSILGNKKTFCSLSDGNFYMFGIDKNGQIWSWGYNAYGQLGDNSVVSRLTPVSILGTKKTFCKINSSNYTSLAIDKNGQVWGWGYNKCGNIGDNSVTCRSTPVSILGNKKTFCDIANSSNMSFGLDKNGQVWAWGGGILGNNQMTIISQKTPVSIHGAKKTFCKISGGYLFVVGIEKNGQVWGWSDNTYGQLGTYNNITSRLTPVRVCF
jgi:alpha-tubulin suppressor-like RCC1 family protein